MLIYALAPIVDRGLTRYIQK